MLSILILLKWRAVAKWRHCWGRIFKYDIIEGSAQEEAAGGQQGEAQP
jgi:hypothetical protein